MLFTDVIRSKRDGGELSDEQIAFFVDGLADGSLPAEQVSSLAMAIFLNGMSFDEAGKLTIAMANSGTVLDWSGEGLDGPVVDKHSTGGVGDKVSFMLAPIAAACGCYVPMISGRGLGHTGGTLDKLEAIPGYRTNLTEAQLRRVMGETGCAIVAASGEIAPADKRLYAVRDVTGTVESIDLITASILSKKLAAGLDVLVLDVKVGSGAFMQTAKDATALAGSLVATANGAGCRTTALMTAMDQPCVPSLGNALEVVEVMRVLSGENRGVLAELTAALCGEVLATAGLAKTARAGTALAAAVIADGRAAEGFARMVAAQGGPADFLSTWRAQLPEAPVMREVPAPKAGTVTAMDGKALGMAVVRLGGGRLKGGDPVDPAVGLSDVLAIGAKVAKGEPLAMVHAAREQAADHAVAAVQAAVTIGAAKQAKPLPLIVKRVT